MSGPIRQAIASRIGWAIGGLLLTFMKILAVLGFGVFLMVYAYMHQSPAERAKQQAEIKQAQAEYKRQTQSPSAPRESDGRAPSR